MELRSAYLSKASHWYHIAPESARENRLLVVQGSLAEVNFYRTLGWQAQALCFAIGVTGGFHGDADYYGVSPWANSWPVDGIKFDALVCNQSASAVLSDPGIVRHLMALLNHKGMFHATLRNPDYYGEILIRTGREIWPQPHDYPHMVGLGLSDLRKDLLSSGAVLVSETEILDNMYHNPEMPHWPSINGWDCTLYLPTDPEARKLHFVMSWQVALQPASAQENSEIVIEPHELDTLHHEVEALLDGVRLPEAGLILDKLFQSGQASAETCNLQGVLYFYRQEFAQAWESFRMAILLEGGRLDFYQNIADVASKANRIQETRNLLERAKGQVAGIEEILLDA